MEENVTYNFNVSTDESEGNILVNAMSYTMYKIAEGLNKSYFLFLIPIGIIGNTLSFLVMVQRHNRKMSFSYYIAALALSDNVTLVIGLITYLQQLHDIYLPRDKLMACSLGNITMLTSSMCSVYLIITMTFERLYSIIIPHKAASFNTVKRAKITIGVIVVFSMLYNIPHLFITVFDGQRCIPYAKPIRKFDNQLYYWFSFVLMFALPFVLLLAMNSVIIHTLRKRSSSPMSKNETEADVVKTKNVEKQIFVILLLVTFGFLILTTPGYMMVLYVLIVDFSKTPRSFATYHLLYHIGQKTYFTNSAINFFLYVISGQKFRTDLVNLFRSSKP